MSIQNCLAKQRLAIGRIALGASLIPAANPVHLRGTQVYLADSQTVTVLTARIVGTDDKLWHLIEVESGGSSHQGWVRAEELCLLSAEDAASGAAGVCNAIGMIDGVDETNPTGSGRPFRGVMANGIPVPQGTPVTILSACPDENGNCQVEADLFASVGELSTQQFIAPASHVQKTIIGSRRDPNACVPGWERLAYASGVSFTRGNVTNAYGSLSLSTGRPEGSAAWLYLGAKVRPLAALSDGGWMDLDSDATASSLASTWFEVEIPHLGLYSGEGPQKLVYVHGSDLYLSPRCETWGLSQLALLGDDPQQVNRDSLRLEELGLASSGDMFRRRNAVTAINGFDGLVVSPGAPASSANESLCRFEGRPELGSECVRGGYMYQGSCPADLICRPDDPGPNSPGHLGCQPMAVQIGPESAVQLARQVMSGEDSAGETYSWTSGKHA